MKGGKRKYAQLSEETKERYKQQKREHYAAKSKKERKAISQRNQQRSHERLAKLTPEDRKEFKAKLIQREKNYIDLEGIFLLK